MSKDALMPGTPSPTQAPVTIWGQIVTQAIAFFGCVVIPTLVTLIAPVSTIEFRNSESGTAATVTRYALLWVPWQTEEVSQVTQVRADITAERTYRTKEERRRGHTGVALSTGQVALVTGDAEVIVQAAPELAKQIVEKFDEFKSSRTPTPLKITAYASWSLSYVLGGCMTALCAFYLTGATLAVLTWPFRFLKRIAAESPDTRSISDGSPRPGSSNDRF